MTENEKIKSFCFIKHEADQISETVEGMKTLRTDFWHFRLLTLKETAQNIVDEVENMLNDGM